jgi:hypothetical protein
MTIAHSSKTNKSKNANCVALDIVYSGKKTTAPALAITDHRQPALTGKHI